MKTYIYILFIAVISIVSCDDYLDIEPIGKVVPKSVEDYRSFLTTAYATTKVTHHILTTYRTDELLLSENSVGVEQYEDIYLWNDTNASPLTLSFLYASFYKIIFHANHVIENHANITGDALEVNQLVGEAYALRALQYFQLVNLYAKPYNKTTADSDKGVPIVSEYNIEQKYDIQSLQEVYDFIVEDIVKAEDLINIDKQQVGLNYRFSKVALKSLKAKVYLYSNEWQKVIETCKLALVMQSNLQDLNTINTQMPSEFNSVESILALDLVSSFDISTHAFMSNNFLNKYDKVDDLRFNLYFTKDGPIYKVNKNSDIKYKSTFRVAELFLNLTEAYIQTDNLNLAKSELISFAKNRYTPTKMVTYETQINSLSKESLYKELLDERAREFAIEGQRWNDLRRTEQPEIIKTYGGITYTLQKNDSRYVIPFPNDAKINNPNF